MTNDYAKVRRYNAHPSKLECIEVVERMPFCLGNAVKYLWRAGLKDSYEDDLHKALYYVERAKLWPLGRAPLDRKLASACLTLLRHDAYGCTRAVIALVVAYNTSSPAHLERAITLIRWHLEHPAQVPPLDLRT